MKKHLLLYFPLDDPLIKNQDDIITTYLNHNVTVAEIALPVHNPILDGQVIRESMERVLEQKSITEYFDDIRVLKNKFPQLNIQIMAYSSLINELGMKRFCKLVIEANVSYVLSPDADTNLLSKLEKELETSNIPVIRFAPYVVKKEDLNMLHSSKGYIFQRSTDGKTGDSKDLPKQLKLNIDLIRSNDIDTPIVIGFGISKKSQVKKAFEYNANGVVIGSAIFKEIMNNNVDNYLSQFDEFYK